MFQCIGCVAPLSQYLMMLLVTVFLFLCRGYGCDKCDMSILTHRFHSNTKQDFDLCLGCFRKEEKEGCATLFPLHTVYLMLSYFPPGTMRSGWCTS